MVQIINVKLCKYLWDKIFKSSFENKTLSDIHGEELIATIAKIAKWRKRIRHSKIWVVIYLETHAC